MLGGGRLALSIYTVGGNTRERGGLSKVKDIVALMLWKSLQVGSSGGQV